MQRTLARLVRHCVVISFQFSTFVSLMQRMVEGITTLLDSFYIYEACTPDDLGVSIHTP